MDFPISNMIHQKTLRVTNSGMLSFQHAKKTVGVSAVELFAGSQALAGRKKMIIVSEGEIYLGGIAVTVANGFPVIPGYANRFQIDFDPTTPTPVYAIAATAGINVRVWEET